MPTASDIADKTKLRVASLLDRQLAPLGLRAMQLLDLKAGDRVADIGCGTGQTCLQLADAVGENGAVLGIDLSAAMAAAAVTRTADSPPVRIVEADAQSYPFEPQTHDAIYSRFGVMFFPDPAAAFRNFHGALKPDGRLGFVCWRSLAENDLDRIPLQAALPHLPADLAPAPESADHFSFGNPDSLRDTLTQAGFRDIRLSRHDEAVTSGDLDGMLDLSLSVGALGKIIRENPAHKTHVTGPVRAALEQHGRPGDAALKAAVWIASAKR